MENLLARLRFRHLRLITELERSGSLRAAAQSMRVTQPALSKTLKEIEAAFGFRLFERSTRGLRPTAEGAVVLRGAGALQAELAHLQEEANAVKRGATAVLRIGAPPFVALGIVPGVLQRLLANDPQLIVRLRENRVPRLFEDLLEGKLDALITTYGAGAIRAGGDARLRYEKLRDEEFAVIASPRHALARRRRVTWLDLSRAAWILPDNSSFARQTLDGGFAREGLAPPAPAIESTSPLTNVRLVARNLGVAGVPVEAMREAERAGTVVRLRVHPPIASFPVALVYRESSAGHPCFAQLRDALGRHGDS